MTPPDSTSAVVAAPRAPAGLIGTALLVVGALGTLVVGLIPAGIGVSTDPPLLALSVAGLGAGVVLLRGVTRVYRSRLLLALCTWLAWALFAALASPTSYTALMGAPGSMLGWFAIALVAAVAAAAAIDWRVGGLLARIAGPIVAIEAVFVFFEIGVGAHPVGTMSNSSFMGEVMVLLLPIVAAGALSARTQSRRVGGGVVFVLGVVALPLADARAASVGVLIWLGLMGTGWVARQFGLSSRQRALLTAALLVVPTSIFVFVTSQSQWMRSVGGFLADRSRIWGVALAAVERRPLIGWGPSGFRSGAWAVANEAAAERWPGLWQLVSDPHNLFVLVLVSTGVIGVVLFVWLLVEIGRGWSAVDADGRSTHYAARAGVLMYVLVGMTAPLHLQTLPLAALVLGASLSRGVRVRDEGVVQTTPRTEKRSMWLGAGARLAAAGLTLAAAALLGAYSVTRMSAVKTPREAFTDPAPLSRLAAAWRYDPYLHYRAGMGWRMQYLRSGRPTGQRRDLEALQQALLLEPDNPVYATETAVALADAGASSASVEQAFNRAIRLFPVSPDAHAEYARYLIEAGDLARARDQLDAIEYAETSTSVLSAQLSYAVAVGDEAAVVELRERLDAIVEDDSAWARWP